jgi:hypothetical protein
VANRVSGVVDPTGKCGELLKQIAPSAVVICGG